MVMVAMTASAYDLKTNAQNGTIAFKVDGEAATTAAAGKTVSVTITPNSGWQTKAVTAKAYTNWGGAKSRGIDEINNISVAGSGNEYSFTMPEANVEVSATFKQLADAAWISLATSTFTYDGTPMEPAVTVKVGDVTIPAAAYTVSYSNNVNAALSSDENAPKVTVSITNSEDYTGEAFATFTIIPATITEAALKSNVYTYAYSDITAEVASVKAGELTVPADGYEVSGNVKKEVGEYTATVTGKGNFTGSINLPFSIKEPEPTIDVEAKESTADPEEEGKEVENVTMVMKVAENAAEEAHQETREVVDEETGQQVIIQVTIVPIVLESINVPATATSEEITVTVPGEIRDGNVIYQVTEIKADAFKKQDGDNTVVTKVILPETEEPLKVADGALKPDGELIEVVTPLSLLDDYSLTPAMKDNFEARKISAVVSAPNKYWTFSSGVDCLLPEGVTAYIAEWDAENKLPRIIALDEDQLKLKDGQRGIKANNGVLMASEKGGSYEIVANPGSQESGSTVATTDANDFEGNCLTPVIVSKNYPADEILILKDNEFHTIKSNASAVKPCKAVFSLVKAGAK